MAMIPPTVVHRAAERLRFMLNRRPVLVLGNQKSGTTAVAALLAEISGLSLTRDLRRLMTEPTLHLVRMGEIPFSRIVEENRSDFARPIIKEPTFTFFYDELRDLFPHGRFAFVMRDPRDNIRSILNRLKLRGDLPDLPAEQWSAIPPAWQYVFDNRWQGIDRSTYIGDLARRWNAASEVYVRHADRMVLVRYETFCGDKARSIADAATRLGLPVRHDISDKVDQQYQSRGDRDVRWDAFFGPTNLKRINEICGPLMERFGYSPDQIAPAAEVVHARAGAGPAGSV